MATRFDEYLTEKLQNPEFKREYEALQPEYEIIKALIQARNDSGLTQKQLSERTGITQADISKLENGNANPSLRTLQRLATGMGKQLRLEFVTPE
ncbi:MAG: helix-turn-helix transcriptional regulator [Clostridia bacterium]|nr:helix-turn-helix transcriptional regulator [Clostridia bacterium]